MREPAPVHRLAGENPRLRGRWCSALRHGILAPESVSNDRLTRQELSWLLAQEARGAAKALRDGVTQLTSPPPPGHSDPAPAGEVGTSLDALDEAITRLGELQLGVPSAKARRGRIDLAALLCEVAPNAPIAMEPGAGTEVFGEEGELRRMLHLLLGQTNSGPTAHGPESVSGVDIRRHGDWVKLSVELGPDSSPTAELERRWLSRMATRHGGRLELEGGLQTMWLPADAPADEMNELRRELEQAQQLGEAYARELAQVFSSGGLTSSPPPAESGTATSAPLETLVGAVAAQERLVRSWLDGVRQDLKAHPDALDKLQRRLSAAQELLVDLEHVAGCPTDEAASPADACQVIAKAADSLRPRAARRGLTLELSAPDALPTTLGAKTLEACVRGMLEHAVAASPKGGSVRVVVDDALPLTVRVIDGGPTVPEGLRDELIRRKLDPSSVGRPDGVSLLAAHCAAMALGGRVSFSDHENGLCLLLTLGST